jgi:protoheme IX farnesyltransferase
MLELKAPPRVEEGPSVEPGEDNAPEEPLNARAADVITSSTQDLLSLTKPRLSSLVICTAAGGMWLARSPELTAGRIALTLLATAGTVGAANALNCYLERDSDRFMARTRNRPLPAGRMEPLVALFFGLSLAAFSIPTLALSANLLTAALGLVAFLSYVLLYTPLKSRSPQAMLVGAIPGAIPPMMGWTAATGRLDATAWVLFAILFFWQLPHFIAIAMFRKPEYAAAGLKSVPLASGDGVARWQMLGYTVALVPVSCLLYPLGVAGGFYLTVAVVLGAVFLGMTGWGVWRKEGKVWARKVFLFTLVYLAGLFGALMANVTVR